MAVAWIGAADARAAEPPAAAATDDAQCVVAVQPDVKSVTFVSPKSGAQGGALSIFLPEAPTVAVGDLVRVVRKPGNPVPALEVVESGSARCQELAKGAAGHHAAP
jgi:hypothetical protein